ncbi:MAG: hypothetical protein ACRDQF_13445, partial [Thermocrispum sp.]
MVDEVNQRDPAGTATLRIQRLYDYEMWPRSGRRPSISVLPTLAKVYRTSARELIVESTYLGYPACDRDVIDACDFRHLDPYRTRRSLDISNSAGNAGEGHRGELPRSGSEDSPLGEAPALAVQGAEASLELFRAVTRLERDPALRETLFELALLVGGVSGLPVLRELTPGERERLATVARSPQGVDARTMLILEKVAVRCRRLDNRLGPTTVLQAARGCQGLVRRTLDVSSRTALRQRLLRVYGELSQLVGWLLYDLRDYALAERYLKEGLTAAQEAKDLRMTTFIHCCMSHMASYRKRLPVALDHAYAARGWAARSGSATLGAYAEQMMAWACAEDGQSRATDQALNRAYQLIPDRFSQNDPDFVHFVDHGFTVGNQASCWVLLNRPKSALSAAEEAFAQTSRVLVRNRGFRLVDQARALVMQRQIDQAAVVASQIAEIAVTHSSARLS